MHDNFLISSPFVLFVVARRQTNKRIICKSVSGSVDNQVQFETGMRKKNRKRKSLIGKHNLAVPSPELMHPDHVLAQVGGASLLRGLAASWVHSLNCRHSHHESVSLLLLTSFTFLLCFSVCGTMHSCPCWCSEGTIPLLLIFFIPSPPTPQSFVPFFFPPSFLRVGACRSCLFDVSPSFVLFSFFMGLLWLLCLLFLLIPYPFPSTPSPFPSLLLLISSVFH